jgi:hypothetical protein
MERNGENLVIVKRVTPADTVILALNNNFILKYTSPPNAMMFSKLDTVLEDCSVLSLMSNVSISAYFTA